MSIIKDLPRIFQAFANTYTHPVLGSLRFGYGDIHNLNLITDHTANDDNQIFMLAEPCTRSFTLNETNTRISGVVFSGAFSLVIKSTIDQKYFNEVGAESTEAITDTGSKYTEHIEPLVEILPAILTSLLCEGFDVNQFDAIDLVNFLDENRDGLLIRYRIKSEYNPK